MKNKVTARSGSATIAEPECPQPINICRGAGGIEDVSHKPAGPWIECRNRAATEIADQQRMAELAEVCRSLHHSPWRIEPVSMLKVGNELPRSGACAPGPASCMTCGRCPSKTRLPGTMVKRTTPVKTLEN